MTEQAKKVTVNTANDTVANDVTVNNKNLVITSALLKQHGACKKGINFFERNFSESLFQKVLNLSEVEIKGDYKGYFGWIKELSNSKFKYDNEGNLIKRISPNGTIYEYKYEYDENGIKRKEISPSGFIKEYNSHGDKIRATSPDGSIKVWQYKYDKNGNIIRATSPDGTIEEWKYEYDEKGNMIKETLPDGAIQKYIFEYDSIGRLIQVGDCYIKYLDE